MRRRRSKTIATFIAGAGAMLVVGAVAVAAVYGPALAGG